MSEMMMEGLQAPKFVQADLELVKSQKAQFDRDADRRREALDREIEQDRAALTEKEVMLTRIYEQLTGAVDRPVRRGPGRPKGTVVASGRGGRKRATAARKGKWRPGRPGRPPKDSGYVSPRNRAD